LRRSARATVREIVVTSSVWTGAVVVALRRHEHLGLVLQATKRLAVHDPVAIALKRRA
jgi:hypothetical protein